MERSTPTALEAWSSVATAVICFLPVAALWWYAPDGRGVPVGFHVAAAIVGAVGLLKACTVVAMRAPSRPRAVFRATLGGVLGGMALTYIAVLAAFNIEERRFEREWVPVWIVASGSTALRPFPFGWGDEEAQEVEALWPVPAG